MADSYLLENGTDRFLLENGTDLLVLDINAANTTGTATLSAGATKTTVASADLIEEWDDEYFPEYITQVTAILTADATVTSAPLAGIWGIRI